MTVPVSVVIHALNEEANIPFALKNVLGWADEVFVVDSDSSDRTQEVARQAGAVVVSRACTRGGLVEQRNWALDTLPFRNEWVFSLDADEYLDDELKREVEEKVHQNDPSKDGYWCRYKFVFMGKWLKRSGMYPTWVLRLFRHKVVRFERREVNAHQVIQPGREGYLRGHFYNHDRKGFAADLRRIDEFATLEARAYRRVRESGSIKGQVKGRFFGSTAERRRFLKNLFVKLPFRPLLVFLYLYIVRAGFLEGREGWDYAFYKAVCEWATSVKIREMKLAERAAQ